MRSFCRPLRAKKVRAGKPTTSLLFELLLLHKGREGGLAFVQIVIDRFDLRHEVLLGPGSDSLLNFTRGDSV